MNKIISSTVQSSLLFFRALEDWIEVINKPSTGSSFILSVNRMQKLLQKTRRRQKWKTTKILVLQKPEMETEIFLSTLQNTRYFYLTRRWHSTWQGCSFSEWPEIHIFFPNENEVNKCPYCFHCYSSFCILTVHYQNVNCLLGLPPVFTDTIKSSQVALMCILMADGSI